MPFKKKFSYQYILLLTAVLIIAAFLFSKNAQEASVSKTSFYLNTVITITLHNTDNEELVNQGMNLCKKYDKLFSKTDKNSEIYAINHSNGQPVTVSDETLYVIKKGIEYGNKTNGIFNIAIGSVSSLWNFTDNAGSIPDDTELQKALAYTDYNQIAISGNSITIPNGMELDLGAIAKGYIGDKLKEFFEEKGITSGLLNLGGNVICIGSPSGKDAFHIGIKKPFSTDETITSVYAKNRSVVTSGVYERCFEKDDVLYHHVLDPATGYPAVTDLYSVTVISDNSMEADILSTTCLILGLEKAQEFIKGFDKVDVIFITDNQEVISDKS